MKPGHPEENLLLDYPSASPILVTLNAINNGYFKVALTSLLSFAAPFVSSFVDGIFSVVLDKGGFQAPLYTPASSAGMRFSAVL